MNKAEDFHNCSVLPDYSRSSNLKYAKITTPTFLPVFHYHPMTQYSWLCILIRDILTVTLVLIVILIRVTFSLTCMM
jgi:hypothetical protein